MSQYRGEAITVCSSTFEFSGMLPFAFNIGERQFESNFKYIDTMPYPVLLGSDFLKACGAVIDYGVGVITVPDTISVKASKRVLVLPNEKFVINGLANVKPQLDITAVTMASDSMRTKGLEIKSCVVDISSDSDVVPVCIINETEIPVCLEPEDHIATLEVFTGKDSIFSAVESNLDSEKTTGKKAFEDSFTWNETTLSEDQITTLKQVLWEYRDIFQLPGQSLGHTSIIKHQIKLLPGSKVVKTAPYRCNPKMREEISKQVQDMLDQGIVKPSESPFSSPVVLVKKPDNTLRFCVDFRRLNAITVPDCHPTGRVDDSLDSLGSVKAKIFSKIDLLSGFWQMELHPDSKPLTAFCCHEGLYEFERLPFGLRNSPSSFARLMQIVLRGLLFKICLVFIDDIIIFAHTFSEHVTNLKIVFNRLREANLKLKPRKCEFGKAKIQFLGHLVSEKGLQPLPDTCKTVQEFPRPKTVKQVRSFLGLSGYFRHFIKDYSRKATPLTNLTKKDIKFEWTDLCQQAFDQLKQALTTPPILAYPQYDDPFDLTTDASDESAGMVLSQIQEGKERVIAYGAKKFTQAEKNYGITQKEALACFLGIKHFEPYLKGNKFKIITDHSALKWLFGQKQASGRIARWIAYMQQFDYTIEHKPGKSISNADGLSRQPLTTDTVKIDFESIDDDIMPPEVIQDVKQHLDALAMLQEPDCKDNTHRAVCDDSLSPPNSEQETQVLAGATKNPWVNRPKAPSDIKRTLSSTDMRKLQLADNDILPFIHYLEEDVVPSNITEARRIAALAQNYELIDGVLYHLWFPDGFGKHDRVVIQLAVPKTLVHDVLMSTHGDLSAGHYGVRKTYSVTKLHFFWKGMLRDVQNWVKSCHQCNSAKKPTKPYKSKLQPIPPFRVGYAWGMDIVGPLKESYTGAKYLLVFMEYATKWAEVFPLVETKAHILARFFTDEIVFRYGAPQYLLSDMGSNVVAQVVNEAAQMVGTNRLVTTPYRPSTDGLVERFNYSLIKQLSSYVDTAGKDWCKFIRPVCFA